VVIGRPSIDVVREPVVALLQEAFEVELVEALVHEPRFCSKLLRDLS
jgi:hypothetical protein